MRSEHWLQADQWHTDGIVTYHCHPPAYRFLDNDRVSEQEILAGHFQATAGGNVNG